jgi:penicillin G amidase
MKRLLAGLLATIAAVALLAFLFGGWLLRSSLPQLDGEVAAAAGAPDAEVVIERDAGGATTVRGADMAAVAYGLGFAHAQDRFFQMDLSRRLSSGELSALLGEQMLAQDRKARPFRFRRVAKDVVADATPAQRAVLEAYTRGVNRGLESLRVRPWEYILLRATPQPWRPEDSILVVHAMWWQLQYADVGSDMSRRAVVARLEQRATVASRAEADASLAASVTRFLYPRGDDWDAPNLPESVGGVLVPAPADAPPVPSPEQLDLRSERAGGAASPSPSKPGSNAWVVGGAHTQSGAALVAGDMHLGLRVPTVWYRARLQTTSGDPPELNGVTLPGVPAVVAGSNGHVAWSFTNSYGDWVDVRGYSCDPKSDLYYTSTGEQRFKVSRERIEVLRGDPVIEVVRESPLGVLVKREPGPAGTGEICWLARWLATEPGATTLGSLDLQRVRSVPEALAMVPTVGIPHQNLLIGDREGRIAWTIAGRIPQGDRGPETPRPIAWLDAEQYPRILDPEAGRLWSGNARQIEGEMERVLGNDETESGMGYEHGARVRQIRDGLLAISGKATPADMLAIQLDDRALFLERWQRLLLATLDEDAVRNQPKRAELRRLVAGWTPRAAPESVGYRLVREFRNDTRDVVWGMLTGALDIKEGTRPVALFEGSLWRLVTEQPAHMLTAEHADWRSFLLARADAVIAGVEEKCGRFERCTWGARNTARIRHPLSASLGRFGAWLDMPAVPLSGDDDLPRVAGPSFGASERFAVSPGRESEGYLHMPGGQAGHPLSPFYRAGFDDWALGRPRPLLPGPVAHTLTLQAAREGTP